MNFKIKNENDLENIIVNFSQKANQLSEHGEYKEAIESLAQLSEIIKGSFGENNEYYAGALSRLASLYRIIGEYSKAEPLLEKALEITRQAVGENDEYYATILTELGLLYQVVGEYSKAEPLFEKALEITRQAVGENNEYHAATLHNLALVYRDAGEFSKAEPLFEKAVEIYRQTVGEKHPWYARSLSNLASLYRIIGEYSKAEPLLEKALEITRQAVGENNEYYIDTLGYLALVYRDAGEFSKAEPLFEKALEITRQVLGEKHPAYATTITELGLLHQVVGEYSKAEPLFEKALEITRQVLGDKSTVYAFSLDKLASLYLEIADHRGKLDKAAAATELSKAEPLLEKALEIYRQTVGEKHPWYAFSLDKLASLYLVRLSFSDIDRRGKLDKAATELSKAEPLLEKALEITRQVLGEKHPAYATTLSDLASLYMQIGEYDKAEPLLEKALEITRVTVSENVDAHYAIQAFRSAALGYAMVCVTTSRQTKALHFLQESVSAENEIIDKIFSFASEGQRMSFIKRLKLTFDIFLSIVIQQFSEDQIAIQNALNLVIRRKSIAAEAITVLREIVLAEKYPQLKSTVLELNNVRREISLKSMAGPTPGETYDIHKKNLEELNSMRERLEKELARHIPEIRLQQNLKDMDSKTISSALPENVLLIEIVKFGNLNFYPVPANGSDDSQWYNWRYLAFILRGKEAGDVQMVDLGNAGFIDKMITSFRTSIIEGRSSTQTGYDLYKQIFYPLLPAIGNCKNLFVAPDGDLSRLPFEVLPTIKDSGTHLLIDDYSITYLTTARDILQINKMSDGLPNESIVAADPDFDLDSNHTASISTPKNYSIHTYADNTEPTQEVIIGMPVNRRSRDFDRSKISFNRLVGTQEEGREISKLLGVQPWTGESVLESALKSNKSPKILHIATHGFFLANQEYDPNKDKGSTPMGITKISDGSVSASGNSVFNRLSGQILENPMLRSGLALAGANTWIQNKPLRKEAEDGILTAEDVSIMDLSNTELVVLSACETGLGEVFRGEGVLGLRRSFILAGAKTLVMSLWKVPDDQTRELMVDFYKRLLSGKPRGEALREAQLSMKKEKYPNPYFWGAFICQGNPGPIVSMETRKGIDEDLVERQSNDTIFGFIEEARTLLEKEQYDNAIKIFDGILMLRPEYIEALNGKGVALCKQKKYKEALECFKEVLQIKPKHIEAANYVDMITYIINKESNTEAGSSDEGLKHDSDERPPNAYPRNIYESPTLPAGYKSDYTVTADPRYLNPTLPAGYKAENLKIRPSRIAQAQDQESTGYKSDYTVTADPRYLNPTLPAGYKAENLKIRSGDASVWYNRGYSLFNLGKYKEAIKYFDMALEINPRNIQTLDSKGVALNRLRKYKEAIKYFDMALEINPRNANTLNNRGIALFSLGSYAEAIECFDMALEINPSFALALNNKGIALVSLKRYAEAIECFDMALEINPSFALALNNKGTALKKLGRREDAKRSFEKAKQLSRGNRDIH